MSINTQPCNPCRSSSGFTLVEIAIVLVIVGLLLGGLLMPLSTQMEIRRTEDTRKTIEEIREAIIGFALANGRLPCPADPTIATGAANAGLERVGGCTGANALGVVAWAALGVPETDAWSRRFTYRVTTTFEDAAPSAAVPCATVPSNASFSLCSNGDNTISDGAANIATQIPAVIVSHGKNGFGAYLSSGAQLPASATPDELQNSGGAPTTFVSRTQSGTGSAAGEFDDVVTWVVPGILNNRMVAAGRLP